MVDADDNTGESERAEERKKAKGKLEQDIEKKEKKIGLRLLATGIFVGRDFKFDEGDLYDKDNRPRIKYRIKPGKEEEFERLRGIVNKRLMGASSLGVIDIRTTEPETKGGYNIEEILIQTSQISRSGCEEIYRIGLLTEIYEGIKEYQRKVKAQAGKEPKK